GRLCRAPGEAHPGGARRRRPGRLRPRAAAVRLAAVADAEPHHDAPRVVGRPELRRPDPGPVLPEPAAAPRRTPAAERGGPGARVLMPRAARPREGGST